MPSFYPEGEYDLAGFCVGVAEKDELFNPETVSVGDAVIGLASSGLHSNGYSLVRKYSLNSIITMLATTYRSLVKPWRGTSNTHAYLCARIRAA